MLADDGGRVRLLVRLLFTNGYQIRDEG